MKPMITLALVLLAGNAVAECPRALPENPPAIPNGNSASAEAMYEAQTATHDYVSTIESYLQCWDPLITAPNYNRLVDRATAAAEAYNTELTRYRQRAELASRS